MIEMRAQAQAAAIRIIAEALDGAHSDEAAKLAVAREVCMCDCCVRSNHDKARSYTTSLLLLCH